MSLADFELKPFETSHDVYLRSFIRMSPAPEVATGEILMASLLRNLGFADAGSSLETDVVAFGRGLESRLQTAIKEGVERQENQLMNAAEWRRTITTLVASAMQKQEAKKRPMSIAPLVPDASLYSLTARLGKGAWNPGNLVRSAVIAGSVDADSAERLWKNLFDAVSVHPGDDIFARILDNEFRSWRPAGVEWKFRTLGAIETPIGLPLMASAAARRFCQDLQLVIDLKPQLTLRQWTAILSSLVRLGAASHVLWTCYVNAAIWQLIRQVVVKGTPPPPHDEIECKLLHVPTFFRYGEQTAEPIKGTIREYFTARVGINLVLFQLDKLLDEQNQKSDVGDLNSVSSISRLLTHLSANREKFVAEPVEPRLAAILERNPKTLQCKHGVTKNLDAFLTYSISRRRTDDTKDLNFDQGYWISKAAAYSRAPWALLAGPVALLTMAHCCTTESNAPRTILDLASHVSRYGIRLDGNGAPDSRLVASLRNLGIVLDSPDAEGGMIVRRPFAN